MPISDKGREGIDHLIDGIALLAKAYDEQKIGNALLVVDGIHRTTLGIIGQLLVDLQHEETFP